MASTECSENSQPSFIYRVKTRVKIRLFVHQIEDCQDMLLRVLATM